MAVFEELNEQSRRLDEPVKRESAEITKSQRKAWLKSPSRRSAPTVNSLKWGIRAVVGVIALTAAGLVGYVIYQAIMLYTS